MTKEETIKDWCYQIWPKHWEELAPSSNSRALFVKEVIKLDPDQDLLKKIELAIIAQTKHWRMKSKVGKVYGICRLSQWIKDLRFYDEFIDESALEIKARENAKHCQCGQPVEVRSECMKCYSKRTEDKHKLASVLNSLGLYSPGQSLQEISQNCREYLLKSGEYGKTLNKMTSSLKPADSGNQ